MFRIAEAGSTYIQLVSGLLISEVQLMNFRGRTLASLPPGPVERAGPLEKMSFPARGKKKEGA